jgi:hypothetical protein
MAPSGQKITHSTQRVHFSGSRTGVYVFQSPVKNPMLDFEQTPAGAISFQFLLWCVILVLPHYMLVLLRRSFSPPSQV